MYTHIRKHVHARVLFQLVIFVVVAIGLLAAVVNGAIAGQVSLATVVTGVFVGALVGFLVGRIFNLSWHESTRKVVMSLDRTSFILLGAYILFRIFGNELLNQYFHGATLTAVTFSFFAGLLIGRFASIWSGVSRILKAQGIA